MDKAYFANIYTKYFKVLYLFSLRMVGDASSAEDIVQDVFMECWRKKDEIDLSTPLSPYLYKLTYHRSLDFIKSANNKNLNLSDDGLFLNSLLYATFTNEEKIDTVAIENEVNVCIDSLPEKCKEVFMLSRHHDLKNREIAQNLGISIKTVEKHISKALQEIRTHLLRAGYLMTLLYIWITHLPPPPIN